MGAGIAAAGWDIVNWDAMLMIASSWVISPVMGGIIAALTLYSLKKLIFFQKDPLTAARRIVPVMISFMVAVFTIYLVLKGLKRLVHLDFAQASAIGVGIGILCYFITRPLIARATRNLGADRDSVNRLFTLPLIFAAALLSFAHGANDVANAVGPLAGVVDVLTTTGIDTKEVTIPIWVMVIGALGISFGLALYGPKLIRTVGSEITELDRSRAFCIALAAAVTVIIASQLGLPISSTHVALGGVFGVGFLREFLEQRVSKVVEDVLARHEGSPDLSKIEAVLKEFRNAPPEDKRRILATLKEMGPDAVITAAQRKQLKKALKRQLVKRSSLLKIASAWIITVPVLRHARSPLLLRPARHDDSLRTTPVRHAPAQEARYEKPGLTPGFLLSDKMIGKVPRSRAIGPAGAPRTGGHANARYVCASDPAPAPHLAP